MESYLENSLALYYSTSMPLRATWVTPYFCTALPLEIVIDFNLESLPNYQNTLKILYRKPN